MPKTHAQIVQEAADARLAQALQLAEFDHRDRRRRRRAARTPSPPARRARHPSPPPALHTPNFPGLVFRPPNEILPAPPRPRTGPRPYPVNPPNSIPPATIAAQQAALDQIAAQRNAGIPLNRAGPSTPTKTTPAKNPTLSKPQDCTSCMDQISGTVFTPPCGHPYCKTCLLGMIDAALASNVLPAKCCGQEFPAELLVRTLDTGKYNLYRSRLDENRAGMGELLYCSRRTCSTRLVLKGKGKGSPTKAGKARCGECGTVTCVVCRKQAHEGGCQKDESFVELEKVRKEMGWKYCPRCGRVVEKEGYSCNVIHCVCGSVFCYSCGKEKPRGGRGYEKLSEGGCNCAIFDDNIATQRETIWEKASPATILDELNVPVDDYALGRLKFEFTMSWRNNDVKDFLKAKGLIAGGDGWRGRWRGMEEEELPERWGDIDFPGGAMWGEEEWRGRGEDGRPWGERWRDDLERFHPGPRF